MPVADAIIARQVRRRLGHADKVVGRDGVLRVRQRHRHQRGARTRQLVDGGTHGGLDLGIHAGLEVFLGHAHTHARQPGLARLPIATRGLRDRGAVHGIVTRDHFEQGGGVFDGASEWPRVVQRRGKGDHAVAGNSAVGWLHADDAAQRSWLTNRAAGVGAQGTGAQRSRNRRRRAS